MRLVFGCDEMVAAWVSENLGQAVHPPYTCIGGTRDGNDLCIGAVFNDYNGSNIEITLYGPHGITRGNLRAIMHYVFVQLGVGRLSAKTRRSNTTMRRLLPRLGFKFEGIGTRYFGPNRADDAIRFVLFPDDARKWLDG